MAVVKTNILESVIKDMKDGKVSKSSKDLGEYIPSKVIPGHLYKIGRKTKKNCRGNDRKGLLVTIPPMSRRRGGNSKNALSKKLETSKSVLEEIKEETKHETDDKQSQNCNEKIPLNENVYIKSPTVDLEKHDHGNLTVGVQKLNVIHDNIYGQFSRTNTEKSLKSKCSQTPFSDIELTQSLKIIKPKSAARCSKKDLEQFLPRKSFFNSHDKVLFEAGYQIDKMQERKKPEWRHILRMHTMEELYPVENDRKDQQVKNFTSTHDSNDDEEDKYSLENVETTMSSEKETVENKKKGKKANSKASSAEKEEYKPLYEYLKYIHHNPEEYMNMANYTGKNVDYKHPNSFVRLGRTFRRGHHGSVRSNMYLHAIYGLKPKLTEQTTQRSGRGDKVPVKKDQPVDGSDVANQEETEIEKLKSRTEKWIRSLTTQQFLKAKELALKDIGEEDINMSKWWIAFKTCKYLRIPSHITEN